MRFVQIRPHAWIIIQKYFSTVSPSMPDQINVEQSRYYGKRKKFSNWRIRIRRFISGAGCNFRRRKVRKRVPLFLAETWARYAAPESNEIRFLLPNICSICSNFNELSRRWWTVALKIAFFFCSFFFFCLLLKLIHGVSCRWIFAVSSWSGFLFETILEVIFRSSYSSIH